MEGTGTGAIRTLKLADGGEVKEQLTDIDDDGFRLTYTILESPLPVENYTGTMQVRDMGDGQSEFTWSSTFEAEEGSEETMKETLQSLYQLGVEGLKKRYETG